MAEFKYEITEHIATISPEVRGWTKELKLISWNGMEPKYDIRSWTEDGSRMEGHQPHKRRAHGTA